MSVGGQGQGSGAFRGYEPGGVPCGLLAFALVDAEEHGIKIKAMDAKIDAFCQPEPAAMRLGVCLQWNVLFLRVWLEKDLKQLRQWPGNQIFGRSRRRTSPICDRLGEWAGAPWLCRAGA